MVINEVLPNPSGDESGAEWVELYNLNPGITPLTDCILYLHETNNNQKVVFSQENFIEKFKVISWDGSWLNNSGDRVRLECGSFTDSLSYGDATESVVSKPNEGGSIGRSPDGTGNFYLLSYVTINEANAVPPTLSPRPTDSPTSTPKPTNTSTPPPTSKPSKTPTPTAKKETGVPTNPVEAKDDTTENEIVLSGDNQTEVLGIQETSLQNLSPTPTEKNDGSGKKFPIMAGILIVAGIGLTGAAFYPIFRKRRLSYNLKDEKEN